MSRHTAHQRSVHTASTAPRSCLDGVVLELHVCREYPSYAFSALSKVDVMWPQLIIGVVASKTKGLDLTPTPFVEFERACELFQNASATNSRAAAALVRMISATQSAELKQRLHNSLYCSACARRLCSYTRLQNGKDDQIKVQTHYHFLMI